MREMAFQCNFWGIITPFYEEFQLRNTLDVLIKTFLGPIKISGLSPPRRGFDPHF